MSTRKKRSLLARVECQLAAMERSGGNPVDRWPCIQRAVSQLASLPLDAEESRRLASLQQQLATLRADFGKQALLAKLQSFRRTLARTDCLLWQVHLRHAENIAAAA